MSESSANVIFHRMKHGSLALAALVLMALAGSAVEADREPYRLGVGDVVSVQVLYHPDFSIEAATVRPDGRINVPVAGDLTVEQRTVEAVAEQIREALSRELREPQVSVRLISRHVEPVYVLGAVQAPGAVDVREAVSVGEAIALAKGLAPTAAPRAALLIDEAGDQQQVDVLAALNGEGPDAAVRIEPGETLLVSGQYLVTVIGRVKSPGRHPVEEGDRAADALATAGGLLDDAALTGRVVRRDGNSEQLDLEALTERGARSANPLLRPGDMLIVPRASRRVSLVGAFAKPGKYDFDPGDRVSDALALAQDIDDDALPGAALLMRADGTSSRLDLEPLLQAHTDAEDPQLRDGDTLVLPRAVERVAVVGMVADPGPMPLEPEMTIMDAIAAAGGWDQEQAHPERTVLWRETESGVAMTRVDAQRLLRGEEGAENPALAPGDVIYVPRDTSMTRDELSRLLLGVSGLLRIAF